VALSFLNFWFLYSNEKFIFYILIQLFLLVFLYLIVQFFRIPHRNCEFSEMDIVCPADGKVVVIEETEETEYFKGKRIQIVIIQKLVIKQSKERSLVLLNLALESMFFYH